MVLNPWVQLRVALHGAETRHSSLEGESVRQTTAVNTNVKNDLDRAVGRDSGGKKGG